jgi:hypothetical protein
MEKQNIHNFLAASIQPIQFSLINGYAPLETRNSRLQALIFQTSLAYGSYLLPIMILSTL